MTHPDTERGGLPSASSAQRYVACPASFNLEATCPPAPETPLALAGTRIHAAQETGDNSGLVLSEAEISAQLTEMEMRARDAWWRECASGDPSLGWGNAAEIREKRFWLRDRKTTEKIASAQVDVAYVVHSRALVIDKKSGFLNPTAAVQNWQLRLQALCIWSSFPSVTHIRVAWQRARFGKDYDSCDYTLEDLQRAEREFLHARWRSQQPDAPFNPGDHCSYCRAFQSARCKAAAAYSLLPSVGLPIVAGRGAQEKIDTYVSQMPLQDLAFCWLRKGVIEKFFKAVKGRFMGLTTEELETHGLQKTEPGKMTSIPGRHLAKVYDALFAAGLIKTPEDFYDLCKVSLTDLDAKIADKHAESTGMTQKSSRALVRKIVEPFTETTQKEPSIVAIKD